MQFILKYSALILLLGSNYFGLAQDFEILKIESSFYPSQPLKESSVNGEVGFREWKGQIAIPKRLKNKKTVLIHKLGYTNLRVYLKGSFTNSSIEETKDYHSILYSLSAVQELNKNWRLMINANPTIATDFKGAFSSDDVLFQASTFAINTKRQNLQYGFGLAYTTRFGNRIVIPIGMFKYTSQKMILNIRLPQKLSVMLNVNKPFNYGLEASLSGGLFNNSGEIQAVNTRIDEAGYSRLTLGPAITYKFKNVFVLYAGSGIAAGRTLMFIDESGESIDKTPENGLFFRMGISIRPNPNKKANRK